MEPLIKGRVIKPVLEHLDYPYLSREAEDYVDERGEQADYSVSSGTIHKLLRIH
jgi:hypothetical protein